MASTLALASRKTVIKNLAEYSTLRTRVREAIRLGRRRAEEAVEREKVRTSWEIGKLIHEHILLNKTRADYGKRVVIKLAVDLGLSRSELSRMIEFARAYPIGAPARKLSWADYRELLTINDEQKRGLLAAEASKNNWTRETLRREIKKRKTAKQITVTEIPAELLEPKKGIPYTYKIVRLDGRLQIDLGFSNYLSARNAVPEKMSKSSRVVFEAKASNVKTSSGGTRATKHGYTTTEDGFIYLNNELLEKGFAERV